MKKIGELNIQAIDQLVFYETETGFLIKLVDHEGNIDDEIKLDKQLLVDHINNPKKALYMQRKGCVRTKVTNDELLK